MHFWSHFCQDSQGVQEDGGRRRVTSIAEVVFHEAGLLYGDQRVLESTNRTTSGRHNGLRRSESAQHGGSNVEYASELPIEGTEVGSLAESA